MSLKSTRQLVERDIGSLRPYAGNARTHSKKQIAQIARSIARLLALDEDLAEALALAHDLGHTPFGHAGQDALHACMQAHGGFEHNLQSLRVVDRLEQRYPAWDGLNLCFETREGILKRCPQAVAERLEARAHDPRRRAAGAVPVAGLRGALQALRERAEAAHHVPDAELELEEGDDREHARARRRARGRSGRGRR